MRAARRLQDGPSPSPRRSCSLLLPVLLLLLLLLLHFASWHGAQAFLVPSPATALTRPCSAARASPARFSSTTSSTGPASTGTSLRDQFFAAVDYELAQRFPGPDPDLDPIARVRRFVASCKAGVIPPEAPTDLPFYQPSEEYVPGLSSRPWPEPYSFPWVKPLEEASPVIQEELARVLAEDREGDFRGDSNVATVMGAGWTALRLQRFGIWNEDVCARFPQTVKLLASLDIPFAVRCVMFARQAAGTGVQPHSDARNFILTAHLGLQVPKDPPGACWMRVAEERRGWEENKVAVIDTTFEHETGNSSAEDRYVLIIDFFHPELTEAEQAALKCVFDIRNQFEGRAIGPYSNAAAAPPSQPSQAQPSLFDNFMNMFGGGK